MTEPTRAERRRQAREAKGPWVPHDPSKHQNLDFTTRLVTHVSSCDRCKLAEKADKECPWLSKFYMKHWDIVNELVAGKKELTEADKLERLILEPGN